VFVASFIKPEIVYEMDVEEKACRKPSRERKWLTAGGEIIDGARREKLRTGGTRPGRKMKRARRRKGPQQG